jgi:hypothetical protein
MENEDDRDWRKKVVIKKTFNPHEMIANQPLDTLVANTYTHTHIFIQSNFVFDKRGREKERNFGRMD